MKKLKTYSLIIYFTSEGGLRLERRRRSIYNMSSVDIRHVYERRKVVRYGCGIQEA